MDTYGHKDHLLPLLERGSGRTTQMRLKIGVLPGPVPTSGEGRGRVTFGKGGGRAAEMRMRANVFWLTVEALVFQVRDLINWDSFAMEKAVTGGVYRGLLIWVWTLRFRLMFTTVWGTFNRLYGSVKKAYDGIREMAAGCVPGGIATAISSRCSVVLPVSAHEEEALLAGLWWMVVGGRGLWKGLMHGVSWGLMSLFLIKEQSRFLIWWKLWPSLKCSFMG
ncbi:hypothetical protein RHSIM_RhsimUnG0161500 [Rhododendron simsii]|uniref:Uncharacterized protein n=1 Tax=Rhododendron simsii TaxID=118357 RepID=A0A834FUD1_RHOSS|nr:hypothetical protein RHSIM_RhsimUnG0161500 [Rhododendron simsii]